MKKVLLLTENLEEFQDCIALFDQLGIKSFVYAGGNVGRDDCLSLSWSMGLDCTFLERNRQGAISKVLSILFLLWKCKPDFVFMGAQMFHHRIAFLIKPSKIKLIVYNRGLLCDISASPIRSFRLLNKLPNVFRRLRVFNPFVADYSLVVSPANKSMLESYSVRNVYCVGLHYNKKCPVSVAPTERYENNKRRMLVFATQAYSSHGLSHMHDNQLKLIEKLMCSPHFDGYQIIIKKHPRDEFCYEEHFDDLVVRSSNAKDFIGEALEYCQRCFDVILLSPPSTFLIEWVNSGLSAFMFQDQEVKALYNNVLSAFDRIDPKDEALSDAIRNIGVDAFEVRGSNSSILYSEEDLDKLKGHLFG